MTKPYNEEQIQTLAVYARQSNIAKLKLCSYVAIDGVTDNEGYTKAHNADVTEMFVTPDTLGAGIESLLKASPGTDVTISSLVEIETSRGRPVAGHIGMLDFSIPAHMTRYAQLDPGPLALFNDVSNFLVRTTGQDSIGPPRLYVSGNSYHGYSLLRDPIEKEMFEKLIAAFLVCDHNKIADHAWLGFCLARGEFRLRVTANQSKYKMLPTLPRDLGVVDETPAPVAVRDRMSGAVLNEGVPFNDDAPF